MKALISIVIALCGMFVLTLTCKAQCDSLAIHPSEDKVIVTKTCWNTIAFEYNRLKVESIEAKKLIHSDSVLISGLNLKIAQQDSLLAVNNSTIGCLKEERLELIKLKPNKGLWFGCGYTTGVLSVIALKLVLW
jgi:hypothetical protein